MADDSARGGGGGLLTSVAGHAAIDRCRSFSGWSEEEAKAGMAGKLKGFFRDLKGVVRDAVMPAMRGRLEAEMAEAKQGGDFVERIKAGICNAIDGTAEVAGNYVRKPVVFAGRGVVGTSAFMWDGVRRGASAAAGGVSWTARKVWSAAAERINRGRDDEAPPSV